ncbi:PQQ-binding-like beta-propeller repeat protein [Maribellus sp. CM-23]|uniref:outer membrane protein assembly factor BamB family protein n=1 Tax=Maribellus sp. CM-23 TaxID=2781026 RepID=UPI001F1CAF29|nr:PQQ-binding-like beta-propeller repeat protein [Maribellus sp. CM-23]MCE4562994.1 PQQ-binding-like beta-propeller repeat protein [Maribellus sp. CM-23]
MTNNDKLKLAQNIALIAGIFCTAVAILLLLNFWQVSKSDPIESKALEALVQRLKQEPNNEELKAEIRAFDLLARKAYFNSQWQVKTGAYLILFGTVVLAFALRVYYSAKSKIEEPDAKLENEIASRILAQKGIVIVGVLVMALAVVAGFATVNHLKDYDAVSLVAENESNQQEEQIEVIEVGQNPVTESKPSESEAEPATEPVKQSETTPEAETEQKVEEQKETVEAKAPQKTAAASSGLTLAALKTNHNSLRGPLGQGVSYAKNIPTEWDGAAGTNVLWKSPIPKHGFNSPIIWGDKIFIAGADNNAREVYCYDRNTGKLLWTGVANNIQGSPAAMPKVTPDTGLSASSLTTDGKAVFAIFASGDVIAFDMNGKRLWARNLGVPNNHYGHSSSLITWAGKLFVQYDTNRGGKVLALNNTSGETVWETTRACKISWASPVLGEVDGKYQLLLTSDPIVAGYNIETGEELWQVECMMGEVGPSVAFSDGLVFAANEYARLVAIDPKTASVVWENDEYLPEAASPLAYNGLLFVATSYGVLVCYDTKTGEQYWEDDLGTTLYSSPVTADGKLFMMDNDGVMHVYEFGKKLKKISDNELGEHSGPTPAFADGRIYIRGDKNLYCIGK